MIFSGPSGVGKDTLLEAWTKEDPRVERVVAYTTRAPRPGETDGVDYHFVSEERFHELENHGAFLESKNVYGNFYATPLTDMERLLDEGKVAVLKIDVQGALEAMDLRPDALTIFVSPPDEAELERRIRERGTDDPAAIAKRLEKARWEMDQSARYSLRVVNDFVERAVAEIREAVRGA